jgi:hypothetical protein
VDRLVAAAFPSPIALLTLQDKSIKNIGFLPMVRVALTLHKLCATAAPGFAASGKVIRYGGGTNGAGVHYFKSLLQPGIGHDARNLLTCPSSHT